MKTVKLILAVFFAICSTSFATYYNTGWKTFTQPDGTGFVGKMEGDEYYFKHVTQDGYSFNKNPKDNYYYYVSGIESSRYKLSDKRVGIHNPGNLPKGLTVHINDRPIPPFEPNGTTDGLNKTSVTTYTLKVVLVEFSDVAGDNNYYVSDFESMLDGANYSGTSPDGENVYGSMDYYYNRMSGGNCRINATILNNTDGNGKPIWLTLPDDKDDYKDGTSNFWSDATSVANSAGLNITTGSTTKLVYIYAGNFYTQFLNPSAQSANNRYRMCEKWGGRGYYNDEVTGNITFSHIGIHCHEFGHLIGFYDQYYPPNDIVDWCLMGDACDLGKGSRPGPICPHYRYWSGWISTTTPTVPNTGIDLVYSETSPTIYRIVSGSDVFYFENREYANFSSLLPGYSSGTRGILVWKTNGSHTIDLIAADGTGGNGNEGYGDMFPGSSNNNNLNDFTSPDCNKLDGSNSQIIMHDVSSPASANMTAVLGEGWFGNVPEDITWANTVSIAGDVTVPSDVTLTIQSNTTIEIVPDAQIEVSGVIDANAAAFASVGGGDWYGIIVAGEEKSYFDNCTITGCTYGFIVEGSTERSPDLYQCDIQATSAGFWITESGHPWVEHSYIKATNTTSGAAVLSTNNAGGYFIRCNFYGPSKYGHKNDNSAVTHFAYYSQARNAFDNDFQYYSIYVTGGIPYYDYGKNSILNRYYLTQYGNCSGSAKNARGNYWGGGNPVYMGTVNYTPILTTMPNPIGPNWSLPKTSAGELLAGDNDLTGAWSAYFEGDYILARSLAQNVFNAKKQEELSAEALFLWMRSAFRLNDLETEKDNLESFDKNAELNKSAQYESLRWLAKLAVYHGDLEGALAYCLTIPPSSLYGREILLDCAVEILEKWGDIKIATEVLDKLVERYTDKETVAERKEVLERYSVHLARNAHKPETSPTVQSIQTNREHSLIEAWPNPFNMSATIKYSLPLQGDVKIDLYDVLGRHIRSLVNTRQESGEHRIIWDGQDALGKTVSSGFYLCRIITQQQSETIKLFLLK